jgi:hypothetical protein
MNTLSRRRLLTLTGAGIVAVAAGGIALAVRQLSEQANTLTFQAVTGLPAKPLLSYASYVISGKVSMSNGTGTITKYVYAGPPESMTSIPLYTRTVRVTGVSQQGSAWHITGVVDNQAQLQKGEDAALELLLDSSHSAARSTFFGSSIQMQLQRFAVS